MNLNLNSCAETGKGKESQPRSGNNRKCGAARSFPFRELATATRGFKEVNLIGEGGFGRVYKGRLESGQVVLAASFLSARSAKKHNVVLFFL